MVYFKYDDCPKAAPKSNPTGGTSRMPDDVVVDQVHRLKLFGLISGSLWSMGIVMDSLVFPSAIGRSLNHSAVGIEVAAATVGLVLFCFVEFSKAAPRAKASLGMWLMVLNAAAIAMLETWTVDPTPDSLGHLSWITVVILLSSMINPDSPRQMAGPQAYNRISSYGTLVGLDLPPASRNLEIKPYALGKSTTDRLRNPPTKNDGDGDVGGDVKYGITANLTADLTVNTDFAQVEVDEQQVNLTRFNLLFPEKRDFFLEGRGLFDFARGGAAGGSITPNSTSDQPYLFYSRRIGLNKNRVIPIDVGGRMTGKVGGWGVGVMNLQAGDESQSATPATNFTVVRLKRDILRRSSIGGMFTNRSQSTITAGGTNQGMGADVALGFYQNIAVSSYYARTATTNIKGDTESYQGKFDWQPDRYGVSSEYLKVGKQFNPEVGFLRRTDFTRSFASGRFSPRPKNSAHVRKYTYQGSVEYYENGAGDVESRQQTGRFAVEFNSSDTFSVEANANYDLLLTPFSPAAGAVIPVGGYDYNDASFSYSMGAQRRFSGSLGLQIGEYYNGTIKAFSFSNGRVAILKQFSLEPRISYNVIDLPTGSFTTKVVGARTDYGFSPRMFFSALLQYGSNDHTFSSNIRYRWEYKPGSELFVVWTDESNTNPLDPHELMTLRNRAFVVKMTRLFRF